MARPTYIDQVELGLGRLIHQWKGKPHIAGLLTSYLKSIQEVEDVYNQLLNERGLGVAVGTQLDVLGLIMGGDRGESDDEEYRARLQVTALVNKSDGTAPVLIEILDNLTNTPNNDVLDYPSATLFLVLKGAISQAVSELLGNRITSAGVETVTMFAPDSYHRSMLVDDVFHTMEVNSEGTLEVDAPLNNPVLIEMAHNEEQRYLAYLPSLSIPEQHDTNYLGVLL